MRKIIGLGTALISFPVFAATPIHLDYEGANWLQNKKTLASSMALDEINRATDFNNTLHIRVRQTYQGYPVRGADAVVHVPQGGNSKASLKSAITPQTIVNGTVYQGLNEDLLNTPASIFTEAQMKKAVSQVESLYADQKGRTNHFTKQESKLIVYVDQRNRAHWAYQISFFVPSASHAMPEKPIYIVDAIDFTVYAQWNDLKTLEKAEIGGFGGNHKTGQKIFDGMEGHASKLNALRDARSAVCYMKNDEVNILNYSSGNTMKFNCQSPDPEHNNVYWNGNFDAVATTWSPSNDALFGSTIASHMYQSWYKIPMLVKNGKPMFLPVLVHYPVENAFWNGDEVIFGDSPGSFDFNVFTSLDTVVHEISHGFTEQHSDLEYQHQSGGLNEAFSDMAGIAAEFYAYGKTDFLVGWGDMKEEGVALRYMDQPSKDCKGREPGNNCSIDNISQYKSSIDVHHSSGIFNRVYYLLANTPGWDAKKAFDVMVQANRFYWTSTSSFADAACGVMKAAQDYRYDLNETAAAFRVVGIDTANCFKADTNAASRLAL